jgi:CSLREA domain-containing protein
MMNYPSKTLWRGPLVIVAAFVPLAFTLVLLQPSQASGGEIFKVNTSSDEPDSTTGDCICKISDVDLCTLRAAIQEANACSGGQTIKFFGPYSITPLTALPTISDDDTVIDASDKWFFGGGIPYPGVVLDGNGLNANGLVIEASNCAVYGMQIILFGQNGVLIQGGAQFNNIGGSGFQQRNIISLNGEDGVLITGMTTVKNTVSYNYIGTNPEGSGTTFGLYSDWGNSYHGISVWYGDGNTVSNNLVADNDWSGVAVGEAHSVAVKDNHIGMDALGQPLGNTYYGVHVDNHASPVVSYNQIAFNQRGIHIAGDSDPTIEHNTIYSNTAIALTPPDGGGLMITGNDTLGLIQHNDIYSNTAYYGSGIAVEDGAYPIIQVNTIQANHVYSSGFSSLGGGGIYVELASAEIERNLIFSNTVGGDTGASSLIFGGGIFVKDGDFVFIYRNEIQGNQLTANAGGGGGVSVRDGNDVRLRQNKIVNNDVISFSYAGSGVDIDNDPSASKISLDRNWIALNSGPAGGAVYLQFSGNITLTNNIIAHNNDRGIYLYDSTLDINALHNTIANNSGSGIYVNNSHLKLYNSILADNHNYGIEFTGVWTFTQSTNNVWGNWLGDSNRTLTFFLTQDPLFFDSSGDQYALTHASPCIDTGSISHTSVYSYNGPYRPQGAGYDIGAYEMPPPKWLPLIFR